MAKNSSSADRVYILGWLDAIEKLDILILELRHLQSTCIYHLRLPDLIQVIRPEEGLLTPITENNGDKASCWPIDSQSSDKENNDKQELIWDEFIKQFSRGDVHDPLSSIRRLVNKHIPLFPDPLSSPSSSKDFDKLSNTINTIWEQSIWGDSRKDLYYVLKSAQHLKRQIFADRLLLFIDGAKKLGLLNPDSISDSISINGPEFWILRMAVLSRAQNYLERMADMQQRLAQHVETMPAEYPRQSIHRRREQGTYTQYLAHRVWHLRTDTKELLKFLGCDLSFGDIEGNEKPTMIFHRWTHNYSSRQGVHLDEVSETTHGDYTPITSRKAIEVVQTNFWAMDRQENQPIICHEIAHHIVRKYYQNLQPQVLANAGDSDHFASLMRHLIHACKSFAIPFEPKSWEPETTLVNPIEIASDLLAASINANAYLLAFVLEAVGWGLEHTIVDQHGYLPHLSINLDLRADFVSSRASHLRDWYLRGRIIIAWLRHIEDQDNPLDRWLLDGVEELLTQINEFLDLTTRHPEDRSGFYWRALADRTEAIINELDTADVVKQWRKERRDDNYEYGEHLLPQHYLRIPTPLRNLLARVLANNTVKRNKYCHAISKHDDHCVSTALQNIFNDTDITHNIKTPKHLTEDKFIHEENNERQLFKHVFDIPWQCSLLRAEDFLKRNLGDSHQDRLERLYYEVNNDTSLGRRLFFIAMEAHLNQIQPPCERLGIAIRLCKSKLKDKNNQVIEDWLKIAEASIYREHSVSSEKDCKKILIEQNNALYKLIYILTGNNKEEWIQFFDDRWQYEWIVNYLLISEDNKKASITKREKKLIEKFTLISDWFEIEENSVRMDMVSRIHAAGNVYASGVCHKSEVHQIHIACRNPFYSIANNKRCQITTLGRYDILSINCDIKPLSRCVIPHLLNNDEKNLIIPFFQRRETWIAVNFEKKLNLSSDKCDFPKKPLAVVYLQLNRRYYRLDFLSWLSQGGRNDIGLQAGDRVFLTHGWADIVIILDASDNRNILGNLEQNPLKAIYIMQQRLFNHFLVRRTELSLTTESFSYLDSNNHFCIRVEIRLRECHFNEKLVDECHMQLKVNVHNIHPGSRVSLTSGDTDFCIYFSPESMQNIDLKTISECFKGIEQMIDHYETHIEYLG